MSKLVRMAAFVAVMQTILGLTAAVARPSAETVWGDAQDAPFWAQAQERQTRQRETRQRQIGPRDTRQRRSSRSARIAGQASLRQERRLRSTRRLRDASGAAASSDGARGMTHSVTQTAGGHSVGPKPGRWCGWYMRTRHGGGAAYNLARNWRNRGTPIPGPQVGAIVVWNHHVGEIVGRAAGGRWLVHSGNDSNRVRTRARSVAGASFRML